MTYRTGNVAGFQIPGVWQGEALVAVVVNGDQTLASLISLLLNGETREAIRLLEYALHLRQHGERAPGGDETWAEFDRRCEAFLRSANDGDALSRPLSAPVAAQNGPAVPRAPSVTSDGLSGSEASCCDLHGPHCEAPSELCCHKCTEAAHSGLLTVHADDSRCVLAPERTVECKLVRPAGPGPTDPCGCRPSQPCAMAGPAHATGR